MPDQDCLNIRLSEYFRSRDGTRPRAEDPDRDERDGESPDEAHERG